MVNIQTIIEKYKKGEKLTPAELYFLKIYPNKENNIIVHIIKAKYGYV